MTALNVIVFGIIGLNSQVQTIADSIDVIAIPWTGQQSAMSGQSLKQLSCREYPRDARYTAT